MKVLNSSHISPFGGLNFVIKELDRLKIGHLLNQQLPQLPNQVKYDWRDLFYSFWSVIFCGGDCAEDLGNNFKRSLSNNPYLNIPSPDRILDRMKHISSPTIAYDTARGDKKHLFSHNDQLNQLNMKILKRFSTFKRQGITLDYDNTLIFTHKADAVTTYLHQRGYVPGVAFIGSHVVYVENRNGNSDAQTLQQDTLQRMFELLKAEKININAFRADSASYQLSTLDVISRHVKKLYVRTRMSESLNEAIAKIDNWEQVPIEGKTIFRGDTTFTPFYKVAKKEKKEDLLKTYRLVVTKEKRRDGQINLFTGEAFDYYGIITNDEKMSNGQIVNFYNQRGAREKEFDVLKNDFGWDKLPFSRLDYNAVYLIVTAMCRNLYSHIISRFSRIFKGLSPNFRIKKFIFRFVCIPAKWIRNSRCWKLRIYGYPSFKT
jgi:hypothetical protein